jgi:hypothetical protein
MNLGKSRLSRSERSRKGDANWISKDFAASKFQRISLSFSDIIDRRSDDHSSFFIRKIRVKLSNFIIVHKDPSFKFRTHDLPLRECCLWSLDQRLILRRSLFSASISSDEMTNDFVSSFSSGCCSNFREIITYSTIFSFSDNTSRVSVVLIIN